MPRAIAGKGTVARTIPNSGDYSSCVPSTKVYPGAAGLARLHYGGCSKVRVRLRQPHQSAPKCMSDACSADQSRVVFGPTNGPVGGCLCCISGVAARFITGGRVGTAPVCKYRLSPRRVPPKRALGPWSLADSGRRSDLGSAGRAGNDCEGRACVYKLWHVGAARYYYLLR